MYAAFMSAGGRASGECETSATEPNRSTADVSVSVLNIRLLGSSRLSSACRPMLGVSWDMGICAWSGGGRGGRGVSRGKAVRGGAEGAGRCVGVVKTLEPAG